MNEILQSLLVTVIQVLLPIALGYAVVWLNAKIKETKAKMSESELALATTLVYQFVLAAKQNGLIGALVDEGTEKKKYVIELAEAELAKRGIKLDLDVLDALIEAAYIQAFGKIDFGIELPKEG